MVDCPRRPSWPSDENASWPSAENERWRWAAAVPLVPSGGRWAGCPPRPKRRLGQGNMLGAGPIALGVRGTPRATDVGACVSLGGSITACHRSRATALTRLNETRQTGSAGSLPPLPGLFNTDLSRGSTTTRKRRPGARATLAAQNKSWPCLEWPRQAPTRSRGPTDPKHTLHWPTGRPASVGRRLQGPPPPATPAQNQRSHARPTLEGATQT